MAYRGQAKPSEKGNSSGHVDKHYKSLNRKPLYKL